MNSTTAKAHSGVINAVMICIIALFAYNNLHAQYTLELEWQKELGGTGLNIWGLLANDSDVLITCYTGQGNVAYLIDSSGNIKRQIVLDVLVGNLTHTNTEGQIFGVAGTSLGILDVNTLKFLYEIDESKNTSAFYSGTYIKKQNKIVAYGNSFIKVYDVASKIKTNEINISNYNINGLRIKQANLTVDGKQIVFSYSVTTESPKNTYTTRNYIKIIDLDGNIIKEINNINSNKFSFTTDGNQLIYFMPDAIHFFDLANLNEQDGIKLENSNPTTIEMCSENKFMLLGFDQNSDNFANSLIYCDLETTKYYILNDNSSWINFKLKKDNSSLFFAGSRSVLKFNLKPTTSVFSDKNKLDISINVTENDLILTSQSEINPTYNFQIISLDGKLQRNILPSEIQYIANGIKIDIANLNSGAYILHIQDGNSIISTLKFLKVN